jgi:predicted  nucleic acid-binding Zn-ribbon protein
MSIDNSMFAELLSGISKNIKNSGADVELELMNINSNLEKANSSLERIAEEMLISNLPKELHKDQRNLFALAKMNESLNYLIERRKTLIEKNSDDIAVDALKDDLLRWEESFSKNLKEIINLVAKGCVM